MQPTSIPDHLILDGAVRQTCTAPDDPRYADVADCEALIDRGPNDLARVHVRLELEAGELEQLAAGGHVWVTFLGGILPFSVCTTSPDGA